MLDVLQPNGTRGLTTTVGSRFRVREINKLDTPTLMHWHGLTPPPHQDGVPIVSQPALRPGETYEYDFPLTEAGTYWMHSHEGLQEQRLLSGPLIIKDPVDDARGEQDVVIELADFSFTNPEKIYANLLRPATPPLGPMKRDANDVNYDAFLANRRPVANPEVFRIESRARVRLRLINSSSATNYTVDLGSLTGTLIAVDGRPIIPVSGTAVRHRDRAALRYPPRNARARGVSDLSRYARAIRRAARLYWRRPARTFRSIRRPARSSRRTTTWCSRRNLRAKFPLAPRKADRTITMNLTGDMAKYAWTIDSLRGRTRSRAPARRRSRRQTQANASRS